MDTALDNFFDFARSKLRQRGFDRAAAIEFRMWPPQKFPRFLLVCPDPLRQCRDARQAFGCGAMSGTQAATALIARARHHAVAEFGALRLRRSECQDAIKRRTWEARVHGRVKIGKRLNASPKSPAPTQQLKDFFGSNHGAYSLSQMRHTIASFDQNGKFPQQRWGILTRHHLSSVKVAANGNSKFLNYLSLIRIGVGGTVRIAHGPPFKPVKNLCGTFVLL
jgi:hypothetical protein